jgi:hypothetical protein
MGDSSVVEEAMLAEARAEVGYADQKASLLLAALGIGFGAIIGGLLAGSWKPSDQGGGELAWWIGVCLAAASVGIAAGAVWPRYARRKVGSDVFYWGHVAALESFDEFTKALDANPPTSEERTGHQLWELSRIVARKYRLIRIAFVAAGCATVAFAASAILAS